MGEISSKSGCCTASENTIVPQKGADMDFEIRKLSEASGEDYGGWRQNGDPHRGRQLQGACAPRPTAAEPARSGHFALQDHASRGGRVKETEAMMDRSALPGARDTMTSEIFDGSMNGHKVSYLAANSRQDLEGNRDRVARTRASVLANEAVEERGRRASVEHTLTAGGEQPPPAAPLAAPEARNGVRGTTQSSDKEGLYLRFELKDMGTMTMQWSRKEVQGESVLAFCQPTVPVPAYRYKANAGNIILGTNIGTARQSKPKKYLAAVASYFREAARHMGVVALYPNSDPTTLCKIVFLRVPDESGKTRLVTMQQGQRYKMAEMQGVAVIEKDEEDLDLQHMDALLFGQKAGTLGAHLWL